MPVSKKDRIAGYSAKYRKKNPEYQRMQKQKLYDYINFKKLQSGCTRCGYNKCPQALHYHHIDPKTKLKSIAQMIVSQRPVQKIEEEIEKCILLCANCHQEMHYMEGIPDDSD